MKLRAIFCLMSTITVMQAQDPIFLNSNQSLLATNPSYAGSNGGVRNQLSYRNQFPRMAGNFITLQNSFDTYVRKLKGGVGVTFMHDDIGGGAFRTNVLSLAYARHFTLCGHMKLIPSLQVSYGEKQINFLSVSPAANPPQRWGFVWGEQLPSTNLKRYADLSAGLIAQLCERTMIGASVSHITQPDVGVFGPSPLPARVIAHASYDLPETRLGELQFMYRVLAQGKFQEHMVSMNALVSDHLLATAGWRSSDAAFFSIGYRNDYLSVLVGYDYTYSRLASKGSGSWEAHSGFYLRKHSDEQKKAPFESY
jgi:type IX secretion system PorP/SprF family membrane protein